MGRMKELSIKIDEFVESAIPGDEAENLRAGLRRVIHAWFQEEVFDGPRRWVAVIEYDVDYETGVWHGEVMARGFEDARKEAERCCREEVSGACFLDSDIEVY